MGTLLAVAGGTIAVPVNAVAVDRDDHVLYWNKVLVDSFQELEDSEATPGAVARAGAMMNIAVYDAVNSIESIGNRYLIKPTSAAGYHNSLEVAIDHAAYGVLREALPRLDFSDEFDAAREQARPTTAEEFAVGKDLGEKTSRAITFLRDRDASSINTPYHIGDQPGDWRPTSPGVPPLTPNWGRVKPFGIDYGAQYRPPLPPALTGAEYAAELNEVKEYGGADTSTTSRTADQTEIAHFWANDLDGTYKAPGHLYALTNDIVENRMPNSDSYETAKLYALMSIALADAGIAAWDAKYLTEVDLWRPETAIQLADTDGNPATVGDPDWEPLSPDIDGNRFSPPFPAYVSGHAAYAGAWAGIMERYTGSDTFEYALDATTVDPHADGVVRTFDSFSQMARENAESRIYLGVHFRSDAEQGLVLGDRVAAHVFAHALG
ncbi:vanadium-dependent haloperoxidase [Streptomyces sp. ST2-7A]|uniref:vanadium-dependent haloperoxidase n=1 Tax=Streptomyces sp. ST2-7A TaxID=2907214 RepID=UPI001F39FA4B|nr:vanadium-dependent haloperoxidase [Streptomyces sp. ST2-7A]